MIINNRYKTYTFIVILWCFCRREFVFECSFHLLPLSCQLAYIDCRCDAFALGFSPPIFVLYARVWWSLGCIGMEMHKQFSTFLSNLFVNHPFWNYALMSIRLRTYCILWVLRSVLFLRVLALDKRLWSLIVDDYHEYHGILHACGELLVNHDSISIYISDLIGSKSGD